MTNPIAEQRKLVGDVHPIFAHTSPTCCANRTPRSAPLGSKENFKGFLRQYVPKRWSLNTIDEEEITMIQNRLNNIPRERLQLKTPSEVFYQSLMHVALQT